jgi:hypothetical protein
MAVVVVVWHFQIKKSAVQKEKNGKHSPRSSAVVITAAAPTGSIALFVFVLCYKMALLLLLLLLCLDLGDAMLAQVSGGWRLIL